MAMNATATDVAVRLGAPGDEAGITNVHVHAWQQSYRGQVPDEILHSLPLSFARRLQWWTAVANGANTASVFVADSAKHGIVGFCAIEPARDAQFSGYGEITAIYCLDQYKGKGIGAKLFCAGQAELVRQGFVSQYLWVLKENPTKLFYERMGGEQQSTEKTIELGRPLVEVVFTFGARPPR